MKTLKRMLSIVLSVLIIAGIIPQSILANAAETTPNYSYTLTGNKGAVISFSDIKVTSAVLDNNELAQVSFTDNAVTVTGKSLVAGTVLLTVNESLDFEIPIGHTAFIMSENTVTVYKGNGANYEVYGQTASSADTQIIEPVQNDDGSCTYTGTNDYKLNVNITKAGGTYVFSGNGDDMSITVNKGLSAQADILLAGLTLSSSYTSPITVKKESTAAVNIKALQGTVNTLSDSEFNNADVYGDTADGGDGTNAEYAESAVIKAKASSDLTLCGKGTLNINCAAKNAVKVGEYGTLTIRNITLNSVSAKNGISCDNIMNITSGNITVNAQGGDAVRSDPDAVNADEGCSAIINISGGTLNLTASSDAIQSAQNVEISGGMFNIQTGAGYNDKSFDKDTMSCKGIKASANTSDTDTDTSESTNTISITGGTFNMNTADDAVHSDGCVVIEGGIFNIYTGDDGVHADTSLTLGKENGDDGAVVINVYTSYEGLEAGSVYIYSGTYNVYSSDDGINAAAGNGSFNEHGEPGRPDPRNGDELSSRPSRPDDSDFTPPDPFDPDNPNAGGDYKLEIYGGNIFVNCEGDGLDSNGTITATGGNSIIWSMHSGGDNSPIDCDGSFTVNGAVIFGAGSSGMNDGIPATGSQSYITSKNSVSEGTVINVLSNGQTVFSAAAVKNVNYVFYTSPTLSNGQITTGGTAQSYTAVFEANGHGASPENQTIFMGGFVTKPADLTADGYTFTGWYTDSNCTDKYDFGSVVTGNVTLYAGWQTDNTSDTNEDSDSDTEVDIAQDEGYLVTFKADNAAINVYYKQDYTQPDEENAKTAYSRNSVTGEKDSTGEGQVNFTVIPNEGYTVESVLAEGTYKNIKNVSDSVNIENTYRITKIESALTVTVNVTEKSSTSDVPTDTGTDTETDSNKDTDTNTETDTNKDTDTNTETDTNKDTDTNTETDTYTDTETSIETDTNTDTDEGFLVTFKAENAVINVYYKQDYTQPDEENAKTAYSRDSVTGEKDSTGNGQVNFTVIPDEGYAVKSIAADGEYKNIKDVSDIAKIENTYRITKIKTALTVTVDVVEIDSDIDTQTDVVSDTDTQSDVVSDTDSQTDVVSDTDTQTDVVSDTDTQTDVVSDTDTQSDVVSDSDTQSDVVSDTDTQTDVVSDTDTQSDVVSDTDTQSDVVSDTDTESDIVTDNDTDSDTETDTDTEAEKYMYGDINKDGKITASDSLLLQRYVIGLTKLDDAALKLADVNGDNKYTNSDCLNILRYSINLNTNSRTGEYIEV